MAIGQDFTPRVLRGRGAWVICSALRLRRPHAVAIVPCKQPRPWSWPTKERPAAVLSVLKGAAGDQRAVQARACSKVPRPSETAVAGPRGSRTQARAPHPTSQTNQHSPQPSAHGNRLQAYSAHPRLNPRPSTPLRTHPSQPAARSGTIDNAVPLTILSPQPRLQFHPGAPSPLPVHPAPHL